MNRDRRTANRRRTLEPLVGACIAFGMVAAYVRLVPRDPGNEARIGVFGGFMSAGGTAAVAGYVFAGLRGYLWLASAAWLIPLGILGAASIGLPILLAGALVVSGVQARDFGDPPNVAMAGVVGTTVLVLLGVAIVAS